VSVTGQDLVGQRIKTIRRQRGLSQAQLAHPELSDSYVSLIESGKRTPTPAVLELLAQKLDCSLTYLLNGVTAEQMHDLELALGYAKLALENGEVEEARRRFADLLADPSIAGLAPLRQEAEYGLALAMEACGDLEGAIEGLSRLRASGALTPERQIGIAIALCRCYRESDDLTSAVRVGEEILGGAVRPAWTDDLVELGATLLSIYVWRADLLRARHFAGELLAAADLLGTPRAIVAACWNAAIVAEHTGHGEEALSLTERALAVQGETNATRNLARLRLSYAILLLRVRPAEAERAREILLRTQRELAESSAGAVDAVRCAQYLAHAELLAGRPQQAAEHIEGMWHQVAGSGPRMRAEMHMAYGKTQLALQRPEEAGREFAAAAELLGELPESRQTAQLWLELAIARERGDDHEFSVAAYSRALECVGV
jgi:transcriptional regulator with XRE-family HTH domain